MSIEEAKDILNEYRGDIIKDVYDDYLEVQDAILTLCPNFEYPDWSYKQVHDFLENYEEV